MGNPLKKALEDLTAYAESEGYVVDLLSQGSISQISWVDKTLNVPKKIAIQRKLGLEMKVYVFLHELGHHELRKDWKVFERVLPITAKAEMIHMKSKDRRAMRRDSYIVASLEEEYLAWGEGLKLAARFGIPVDLAKWTDYKVKCLKSYIRYYADKKK